MIAPNIRRIMSQDFPDDVRAWINSLLIPLNQFMTSISVLLNKGLTFQNHFNAEIKIIRVASTDQPMIPLQLKSKPIGVLVLRSEEETRAPIFIDWVNAEGGIKIRHVLGGEFGKFYTLTLLIIGG